MGSPLHTGSRTIADVHVPPERAARVHPAFEPALACCDEDRIDDDDNVVFGLLPDLTIGYVNRAWFRSADDLHARRAIDAWALGAPLLDAITGPLRPFFEQRLRAVLAERRPWEHKYSCPTPVLERTFSMRVLPIGREDVLGLLVTNALVVAEPMDGVRNDAHDRYRDPNGVVVQCGHCRRTRAADNADRWDFVAAFVREPPRGTSHGLCPPCLAHHFPKRPGEM